MLSTIAIGFIGGLITGISPCILPILPLVLAVSQGSKSRPWLVIGGLVTSFTVVTLFATTLLNALGLPADILWKLGIALLVLVGLGMIFPKLQELLEWPFQFLPRAHKLQARARDKGGFAVGLAMGIVFVPCAGPVLAAITVAGATGEIDARIAVLCISFAIGVAIPLLAFALGGQQVGKRVDFFQSRQRIFRATAGVIVIAMAGALALGAPAWIQQKLPNWTGDAEKTVTAQLAQQNEGSDSLEDCRANGELGNCGTVPELVGLENWMNTDGPVDPRTSGDVTLIDFWAYACINCQRANTHITKLYDHYRDYGFTVIGVHSPEYAFERETANVRQAVSEQNINYPVAQDNSFATWKAFNNHYWPAHYLVDAEGTVREIHEGEGAYARTEQLVRELLQKRDPSVELPAPLEDSDDETTQQRNPETYLGSQRARYYANSAYKSGTLSGPEPEIGQYTLEGDWTIDRENITAGDNAKIRLNYRAALVQAVVSGTGTIKANGKEFTVTDDGTVNLLESDQAQAGILEVEVSPGLSLYSFTFG